MFSLFFVSYNRMQPMSCQTFIGALVTVLVSMETTSAVIAWQCPNTCECDSRQQTVRCAQFLQLNAVPHGLPKDVRTLYISDQNFTVVGAISPWNLENLRKVEIVRSNIQDLQNNSFATAPKLRRLNLSGNNLIDIAQAITSRNLKELILCNNYIQKIDAADFKNMTRLRILDLSINMIAYLPPGVFHSLEDLRKLNLSYNAIMSISGRTFSNLGYLEDMYLSNNRIISLAEGWMNSLRGLWVLEMDAAIANHTQAKHILPHDDDVWFPNLQNLKIASNGIRDIPCRALQRMPNVKLIDLSHNSITNITNACFDGLTSITEMVISHNEISVIEEIAFINVTGLQTLDLTNNRLNFFYEGTFYYTESLKSLYLNYNDFRVVTDITFAWAFSLFNIFLKGNAITDISPYAFQTNWGLQAVDLRENRLMAIRSEFVNVSGLSHLALADNDISYIQPNAFEGTSLQLMYLHNNSLRTFPQSILSYTPYLVDLTLQGNPWHCNCTIRYFITVMASDEAYAYPWLKSFPKMSCESPKIFHNDMMQKVKPFQMICSTYASALAIQLIVGLSLTSVAISTALYVMQLYCKAKKLERNGSDTTKCLA